MSCDHCAQLGSLRGDQRQFFPSLSVENTTEEIAFHHGAWVRVRASEIEGVGFLSDWWENRSHSHSGRVETDVSFLKSLPPDRKSVV